MSLLDTPDGQNLAMGLLRIGVVQIDESNRKARRENSASVPSVRFSLHPQNSSHSASLDAFFCKALGFVFAERLKQLQIQVDGICGIPTTGYQLALGMAHMVRLAPSLIRLAKHDVSGAKRTFSLLDADELEHGAHVLLVDGRISFAETKMEAIKTLRANGFVVEHLFVVVDNQCGGVDRMCDLGVSTYPIFQASELDQFGRFIQQSDPSSEDQ